MVSLCIFSVQTASSAGWIVKYLLKMKLIKATRTWTLCAIILIPTVLLDIIILILPMRGGDGWSEVRAALPRQSNFGMCMFHTALFHLTPPRGRCAAQRYGIQSFRKQCLGLNLYTCVQTCIHRHMQQAPYLWAAFPELGFYFDQSQGDSDLYYIFRVSCR